MTEYKSSILQAVISKFVYDRDTANANIEKYFINSLKHEAVDVVFLEKEIIKFAEAESKILAVQKLYARLNNLKQLEELSRKLMVPPPPPPPPPPPDRKIREGHQPEKPKNM